MRWENNKYYKILINDSFNWPETEGFWILLTKKNINEKKFKSKIEQFVFQNRITCVKLNILVRNQVHFKTPNDRIEIHRIGELVKEIFKKEMVSLVWLTNFEEDSDYLKERGVFWLINELEDLNKRMIFETQRGNFNKAKRIEREWDRKISIYEENYFLEKINKRVEMKVKPVFNTISYDIDPKLVFVLMPFGKEWSNDTIDIIREVGKESDLDIMRADDILDPTIIIEDIWKMLNKAGLIIADITDHNANVFYELGIAHTIGKKVVLLKKKGGSRTPFDIAGWRYIEYDINQIQAKELKLSLANVFINYKKENSIK